MKPLPILAPLVMGYLSRQKQGRGRAPVSGEDRGHPAELGSLTWPRVEDRLRRPDGDKVVLIVPLGATEQHGPHLPIDTDTIIATAWARAVATAVPAIVAPALPYGASGEHQGFAGTLSIGHEALATIVVELCRSARHDFDQVLLLSGHAGNLDTLEAVVHQLDQEGHRVTARVPTWARAGGPTIDAHAGRTETSLMLHLRPQLIDRTVLAPPLGRAGANPTGETKPLAAIMDRLRSEGVAGVSASGILGDVGGASADEGRCLFDDLVATTIEMLTR